MADRPRLLRKVTFKRRSNVIQLTTFFESLNQQYEQELKEQQAKNGSLEPEEEQKILSDSPYPFDFEEEEVENEDQDSNTETESASEQQLNGSSDKITGSKKDVYPEKLNVKVTTISPSVSNGDLKSEPKSVEKIEVKPKSEPQPNGVESHEIKVEHDDSADKQPSGRVSNLKSVWEQRKQQSEEEALKERQAREELRQKKLASMERRKSKSHDVHINSSSDRILGTTTRPTLIQPNSPRPETVGNKSPVAENSPKDKERKSRSPKSPRKHRKTAESAEPNGVHTDVVAAPQTQTQTQPQHEPVDEASPETQNIFNGTKSQSDPALGQTETDSTAKDELKNSMSTPNIVVQVTSEPTSVELTTPRKRDKDKDKDKKRDKDRDKDKSRSRADSPKESRVKTPKDKDKTRRPKKRDDDPIASTSGTNTNATTTPVKSKERRDPETPKSTRSHKRSSTELMYDKYEINENSKKKKSGKRGKSTTNVLDGKGTLKDRRKKKRKKDPAVELTELKDSFAKWKPTTLTHSWEIDGTDIEFVEKIGEGTSCSVYKGVYRNQVVALKVLKDLNERQLDNFTKEFTIMSQFRSPDIVFFFGACIKPTPVMVLGYSSRGSLYSVMKDSAIAFTWPIIVKVLYQVARGLHSLHNWKPQIVHRDLKSRNILVDDDWQTKLCDFGESRQLVGNNLETLCKMRGTYAYISPEVYFGQSFTPKSDVYAFAIVAWELVTKCVKGVYQAPYAEFKTLIYDFQIIVQAARRGIRPTIDKSCPVALASMIQRCWNHIPDVRPTTNQLLQFLEEIGAEPDTAKWINVPHVLEPPMHTMPPGGGPPPPSSTDREK